MLFGVFMTERLPKVALIAATALFLPAALYLAYARPGYFTSPLLLGSFLLIEVLLLASWLYRSIFLPVVLVAFLFAGVDLPVGGFWTAGRWFFLAMGAAVGSFILLKERGHHFRLFHALVILSVLAALVSSAVSHYPGFAALKATSLLLLFLYAGTGARLSAAGRESRFAAGLLLGAEIFVAAVALFYLAGREAMGNPNSLGAIMSVFAAPILLWGALIDDTPIVHHRRMLLFGITMYFVFHSQARAALLAAVVSCSLLCLCLRRYRLFTNGVIILVILATAVAILDPDAFWTTLRSTENTVVYKDKDASLGVLSSRQTPWENAMQSIRKHIWFGSGFGTTDNGVDASAHLAKFSTTEGVTSENGSSYLSIVSWVGVLGVLPFVSILLSLLTRVLRTCYWMLNTGSPYHLAVPLAMVVLSGLIHASFEDWMFAPGYYLCVFFWCMAFILIDYAPWAPLPGFSRSWRSEFAHQRVGAVASVR
jgi:O-antigen ligase